MAFLHSDDDSTSPQTWVLERRITTIGAGPAADIQLSGDDVADTHATISLTGPHFAIRRAADSAPVAVNDNALMERTVLEHGDTIGIGDCRLEFSHLREPRSPSVGPGDDNRRRLESLEYMQHLAVDLLGTTELEEIFEGIIDAAIELTDAEKGFLLLADSGDWTIRVARQIDPETLSETDPHLSDSILDKVIATREPIIVSDARNDAQFREAQSIIDLELCSVLCVPLLDQGELLGVLYVGNDSITDLFDRLDLELLSIFAAQLSLLISRAIVLDELREDRDRLQQQIEQHRFGSIIGSSEAMEPVFHAVDRVAPTDVTVLITGETGTGKELVAAELHRRSNRAEQPFITINCGAIPEDLLESELFGHEKGAFTGAESRKDGKFHAADGGTIFLDEIGEMPPSLQVKMLRVLQERKISRVGANTYETVDIRVLAATNRQLQQDVADGDFREDLYYRLNVVELHLPPIRDRGDDVVLLARYLVDTLADELDLADKQLSADAIDAIRQYHWPGNVRQLENRIKKALVLATGSTIGPTDLDLEPDCLPETISLAEAKEEFALDYVLTVLERNDGNRSQTARDLDIDPRTVFRYLEKSES